MILANRDWPQQAMAAVKVHGCEAFTANADARRLVIDGILLIQQAPPQRAAARRVALAANASQPYMGTVANGFLDT